MIRISIVEDERSASDKLIDAVTRYAQESSCSISTTYYPNAESFLEPYHPCDLVFMDIDLPGMSGMNCAQRLREIDSQVTLVFLTNLSQFALDGYKVDALDYLLKPLQYYAFSTMMDKAIRYIRQRKGNEIILRTLNGVRRFSSEYLYYIEVSQHHLLYHTNEGIIDVWGSLSEAEKDLPECFARCNSGYLVNLSYVTSLEGSTVLVAGDRLAVSRAKKKEFVHRLSQYWGG